MTRISNERQTYLRKAFDAASLHYRLAEPNDGICNLNFNVRVDVAQVIHHAVHIKLSRSKEDMLPALLDPSFSHGVRLRDATQSFHHLWKFCRIQRLDCKFHRGLVSGLQM
jgi:hypothetical protein